MKESEEYRIHTVEPTVKEKKAATMPEVDQMQLSRKALLQNGILRLQKAGIEDAATDAWLIYEAVFQCNRAEHFLYCDEMASVSRSNEFSALIKERLKRIPVQQLLHQAWFYGRVFYVDEHVLIPRQDTETLVEAVLERISPADRILDLCTGSGCILLTILAEQKRSGEDCVGIDLSEQALAVARKNASHLKIHAQLIQSDLFENIEGRFDVITANPPYIKSDVIDTLEPEVSEHESRLALDGAEDGLAFYRRIAACAAEYLNPEGILAMEIGYDQGAAVMEILASHQWNQIECKKDPGGNDRVILAKCPKMEDVRHHV